jgi:uncharacterized protein (TIGR02444 family)
MRRRSTFKKSARNPFWIYSLRLYRKPGVAPACLALQDRLGLDVNMLLFCLWAGSRGLALAGATIRAAVELSSGWSTNVVRPLRSVRRTLKPMNQPALRASVARVELAAEKVEQDLLFALVSSTSGGGLDAAQAVARNLAGYFRAASLRPTASDLRQLTIIMGTGFPGADDAAFVRSLRRA